MGRHSKKEFLGAIGVLAAIAVGAALPVALSAAAPGSSLASKQAPVSLCSPPTVTPTTVVPVANFSPPCMPRLLATPDTGLADGQTIAVTGSQFAPDSGVGMAECEPGATGPSQCDLSTLLIVQTDDTGSFSTSYTVARIISITNATGIAHAIDCARTMCILGAANLANYANAAFTPLSFNPKLPLLLNGTVDPTGTVAPKVGTAVISGTVVCERPLAGFVDVQLTQIWHRFIDQSNAQASFVCTKRTAWSVTVPPGNLIYDVGDATAQVQIVGVLNNISERVVMIHRTVKLQRATTKPT